MIDGRKVLKLFEKLGAALERRTTLCLIGSTPGIASGQPSRQTSDFDVWHSASDYDAGDLLAACKKVGILYDPKGQIDAESAYIQIVRPGVVRLPADFDKEQIGRFGNLTLVMPKPELIAALKLVRGSELDIWDVVWWARQRDFDASEIEQAIGSLPRQRDRETARKNIVLVKLVMA